MVSHAPVAQLVSSNWLIISRSLVQVQAGAPIKKYYRIAFYLIRVRGKIPRLGIEFLEGFILGIRIIRDNVLYNVATNVYRRDTLIYLKLK